MRAAAPAGFVLLWSTGFVGAKYGLPYADPLTFLALRLAIAAALLTVLVAALGAPRPATPRQYADAAVAGVLLHAGYLGGVFVAISLGISAGVSAVVVSLQPVLTAVLAARLLDEQLVPRQWAGLVIGVVGVAMVLAPGLTASAGLRLSTGGLAACLLALVATTAGTLWQKRFGGAVPLLAGTAVQYVAATAVLGLGALLFEDRRIVWNTTFVASLVWLILGLSLGAVLLLLTLLRHGTAASVSSLFYLVPPATAAEAYVLFDEQLPPVALAGLVVAAAGVALVVARPRR